MIKGKNKKIAILMLTAIVGSVFSYGVQASETDGTIDSTNKYAWAENIGWINFGSNQGNVHITDEGFTGYAWGENVGWISLSCSNTSSCLAVDYGVEINSDGELSGYAWAENIGWINFNPTFGGVSMDSSGNFSGYAWGENTGWVVFNCSTTSSCGTVDYKVSTDYRSVIVREEGTSGGGSIPGATIFPSVQPSAQPSISPIQSNSPIPSPISSPGSSPLNNPGASGQPAVSPGFSPISSSSPNPCVTQISVTKKSKPTKEDIAAKKLAFQTAREIYLAAIKGIHNWYLDSIKGLQQEEKELLKSVPKNNKKEIQEHYKNLRKMYQERRNDLMKDALNKFRNSKNEAKLKFKPKPTVTVSPSSIPCPTQSVTVNPSLSPQVTFTPSTSPVASLTASPTILVSPTGSSTPAQSPNVIPTPSATASPLNSTVPSPSSQITPSITETPFQISPQVSPIIIESPLISPIESNLPPLPTDTPSESPGVINPSAPPTEEQLESTDQNFLEDIVTAVGGTSIRIEAEATYRLYASIPFTDALKDFPAEPHDASLQITEMMPGEETTITAVSTVALTSVAGGALVSTSGALSAFANLPFYLGYLVMGSLEALGIKKRRKPWGVVYNSLTKQPVPFAQVVLFNQDREIMETRITDQQGRFGFLVAAKPDKPQFTIEVNKADYRFPSTIITGTPDTILYDDVYTGGEISLLGKDTANMNIPLDPINPKNEHPFSPKGTLSRINTYGFWIGAVTSPINYFSNPNVISLTFLILLALIFIARWGFKARPFGVVKDSQSGLPIPFALIVLKNKNGEKISSTVADENGRYFLLTQKGDYTLSFHRPTGLDSSSVTSKDIELHTHKGWVTLPVKM